MILWLIMAREFWEEAFDRLELYLAQLKKDETN